jgi:hypothetical protein
MSLAGGVLTIIVMIEHKIKKNEGRPEVPYGVRIAFGGLWLLAQRFLNHLADGRQHQQDPRGEAYRHGREESCAAHRGAGHCSNHCSHGQEYVYRRGAEAAAAAPAVPWGPKVLVARKALPVGTIIDAESLPIRHGRRNSSRALIIRGFARRVMSPR